MHLPPQGVLARLRRAKGGCHRFRERNCGRIGPQPRGLRSDARVFSAADNKCIFHPKVYWLDSDERKVVVIGSANATVGGLVHNLEASDLTRVYSRRRITNASSTPRCIGSTQTSERWLSSVPRTQLWADWSTTSRPPI